MACSLPLINPSGMKYLKKIRKSAQSSYGHAQFYGYEIEICVKKRMRKSMND
jgi:hypothetical protein